MVITSYGLLFHCPNIKKLLLYITVRSDVMGVAAKDIGTHAIGTCYKNLTCFVLMVSPFSLSTEWFLWSFFHFHMMEAKLETFVVCCPSSNDQILPEIHPSELLSPLVKNFELTNNTSLPSFSESSFVCSLQHARHAAIPWSLVSAFCSSELLHSTARLYAHPIINLDLTSLRIKKSPSCSDFNINDVSALIRACPNLQSLNISHCFSWPEGVNGSILLMEIAKLRHLRSLSLPLCMLGTLLSTHRPAPKQKNCGFKKGRRIGIPSAFGATANEQLQNNDSPFGMLMSQLKNIRELEIMGASVEGFYQNVCCHPKPFGEMEMLMIARLKDLEKLTLFKIPNMLIGNVLVTITSCCANLQELSLTKLGEDGQPCFAYSLREALLHCQVLRIFKLQQPHFNAEQRFFDALQRCTKLEQFCLLSAAGQVEQDSVLQFVAACPRLVACLLYSGLSLKASKELERTILARMLQNSGEQREQQLDLNASTCIFCHWWCCLDV
uniref:F-box/LRR-repeat protein 18-like isoform X2 n=1 Tax=Myxine glutinosa TaxID=7769 RepID=UPI00358E689E